MIKASENHFNKAFYLRLIALWVICEAFAGGILHGFKIPFTGLGVSSLSVFCIILIGYYFPKKGSIIKATIIVAIFKLMLSPHAPPTAYIALFFQGLVGQILLQGTFFKTGAVLLGILALTESAIQRILVLVIIYGKTFWLAVDEFVLKLFSSKQINSFSLKLAISYVIFHAITGFFVGRFAANIALKANNWKVENLLIEKGVAELPDEKQHMRINKLVLIVWLLLMAFYFQQYFLWGIIILNKESILQIILRSLLIITGWMALISPMLKIFLRNRMEKSRSTYEQEVVEVMKLIPETKYIVEESWRRSLINKKRDRKLFFKQVMVNILYRG